MSIVRVKRAVRFFNTTGPSNPYDHYMLPPAERLVGAQLHRYIRDSLYWVLHAPRQTGKTTFLQSWMREINAGDQAVSCYVTVERCQGVTTPERAMPDLCKAVQECADSAGLPVPELRTSAPNSMLSDTLRDWAKLVDPKPLVVLFDETDVLEGETLISFLRQLRGGFADRGAGRFPSSIALVGMKDLKDYITAAKGGIPVNPGSPFNIKEDSSLLGNFSKEDVRRLFAQRTGETGQKIAADALDYVFDQSRGQPWIVNSLFKRATMRVLDEDSRETVTLEHLREARKQMIEGRETHLDTLGARLRDPKIRKIIETIITGENNFALDRVNPEVELVTDLGLIGWTNSAGFTIANPIYEEILTRYLNTPYHDNLPPPATWQWQKPDGNLDLDTLLREFQRFWRKNSEVWEQKSDYTEAFPHLLVQAFLQRILNGGGNIEREYAAGRGRMDLAIEYNKQVFIIEIKLVHSYDTAEEVREEGLAQIAGYRDKIDRNAPAYLMIFDRRPESKTKSWDERLSWTDGAGITVIGL
jgi:ASC-1-like (ASCH) protein